MHANPLRQLGRAGQGGAGVGQGRALPAGPCVQLGRDHAAGEQLCSLPCPAASQLPYLPPPSCRIPPMPQPYDQPSHNTCAADVMTGRCTPPKQSLGRSSTSPGTLKSLTSHSKLTCLMSMNNCMLDWNMGAPPPPPGAGQGLPSTVQKGSCSATMFAGPRCLQCHIACNSAQNRSLSASAVLHYKHPAVGTLMTARVLTWRHA